MDFLCVILEGTALTKLSELFVIDTTMETELFRSLYCIYNLGGRFK